jgi:hypothetical protein
VLADAKSSLAAGLVCGGQNLRFATRLKERPEAGKAGCSALSLDRHTTVNSQAKRYQGAYLMIKALKIWAS